MRLEQYEKAIYAFGNSITIDERDTDAWGNIANCYHAQDKYVEALACTEQALKINRRNWKLWHNAIRFSLAVENWYKAVYAINSLL